MTDPLNKVMRRELVAGAGHIMPGAANALAARLIEAAGYKMMMLSGAAVANTYLGMPDIGLVSVTELAAHVAAVRDAVGIPILADADTGFRQRDQRAPDSASCSSAPVPTRSCSRIRRIRSAAATLKART